MTNVSFIEPRSDRKILLDLSRQIRRLEPQESIPGPLLERFDELVRKVRVEGIEYSDAAQRIKNARGTEYERTWAELDVFCQKITEALLH